MKKYVIIALLAAVLCGVCFYGFMDNLDKRNAAANGLTEVEAKPEIKTVGILSASQDIPENTAVTEEMIKVIQVTEDSVPDTAVFDVSSVLGLCASRDISAGEVILTDTLIPIDEVNAGLSSKIPEGMRAVTVGVDSITGVAGYIRSGDFVDMLQVMTTAEDDMVITTDAEMELELTSGCVVKTIASGVEVLETGSKDYEEGQEIAYTSLTVCLSPEKCYELAAAEAMGSVIIFTLRPKGSTGGEYSEILSFSEM